MPMWKVIAADTGDSEIDSLIERANELLKDDDEETSEDRTVC